MGFGLGDGVVGDLDSIEWMGFRVTWFAGGGEGEGEDLMAME